MSIYIRAYHSLLPTYFEDRYISKLKAIKGSFGVLGIPINHPFYPSKSDSKIMRVDVVAAIIVIQELLEDLNFNTNTLESMGLFVANGAFVDEANRNIKRIMKGLQEIRKFIDPVKQLKYAYKTIPPLSGLETLTNSTMSFVAQYTGAKGNNATFGNTSYGGYSALVAAIHNIQSGADMTLVGGANGSGTYSALAHLGFYDFYEGWKESESCAFVLLQNTADKASAKITKFQQGAVVPSLLGISENRQWNYFFKTHNPACLIYSGGFTPAEFERNKLEAQQISDFVFSLNEEYGSLGAASLTSSISKGVDLINNNTFEVVDIVDRDPYGRETYLQIKKIDADE